MLNEYNATLADVMAALGVSREKARQMVLKKELDAIQPCGEGTKYLVKMAKDKEEAVLSST
jgi:hypothetical protein